MTTEPTKFELINKTTVADLLEAIGDHDPADVLVEYSGCGTHGIELILEVKEAGRPHHKIRRSITTKSMDREPGMRSSP